jgi:hypothetical protein
MSDSLGRIYLYCFLGLNSCMALSAFLLLPQKKSSKRKGEPQTCCPTHLPRRARVWGRPPRVLPLTLPVTESLSVVILQQHTQFH